MATLSYPDKLYAVLRDVPLFSQLDIHVLGHLAARLEPFHATSERPLIEPEAELKGMYLVVEGRLEVRDTDGTAHLGEVAAGEVIGEWSLVHPSPAGAIVQAAEKCRGNFLSRRSFLEVMDEHPDEMESVARTASRRMNRASVMKFRPSRDTIISVLSGIPLFRSLGAEIMENLESHFRWMFLHKGDRLLKQGDPGTQMYVVLSGRLAYYVTDDASQITASGHIETGDVVGETAILTQEPRSANVVAARDSELLSLHPSALTNLVINHPKVLLELTRTLAKRLHHQYKAPPVMAASAVAFIPLGGIPDLRDLVDAFCKAYGKSNPALVLESSSFAHLSPGNDRETALHRQVERILSRGSHVILVGSCGDEPWNLACAAHADRTLMLLDSDGSEQPEALEELLEMQELALQPAELVILHDVDISGTGPLLSYRRHRSHHHVRRKTASDWERLVRFLTGRSVGLALGGGGARGLAHIGTYKALCEAGMPIDLITGTSIGAMVGAAIASEIDPEAMVEAARRHLVQERPFRDPVLLPFAALLKGQKIGTGIRRFFGGELIEDLSKRFIAVASDLDKGSLVRIDRGPIWNAIRASVAIPGLIPPLLDSGRLLADGGLINNAPSDIARDMGAASTILVNVSGTEKRGAEYQKAYGGLSNGRAPGALRFLKFKMRHGGKWPGPSEILSRSFLLGAEQTTRKNSAEADYTLDLPVGKFSMLDFDSIDEIIAIGYRHTAEAIENGIL